MVPAWILDVFAALMLVVAAVSSARLIVTRARPAAAADADIDAAHVLMGVAMAGMLASSLNTLSSWAWLVIFAVVTAWFAWRVAAGARRQGLRALSAGHHVPHLVHGAAMVYMFAALTSPPGGMAGPGAGMAGMTAAAGGMGTLQVPTIGLVFVLIMAGWAVWDLDQLTSAHRGGHRPAPRLAGLRGLQPALAAEGPAGDAPGGDLAARRAAAPGGEDRAAGTAALPAAAGGSVPAGRLLDPRVATGCRIAMAVTMALMLVLMI